MSVGVKVPWLLHLTLSALLYPALSGTSTLRWKAKVMPSIDTHPKQLRVYVTGLPPHFQNSPPEDLWGFRALGQAVDIDHHLWDPAWSNVNKWWINQLHVSPLRTTEAEDADVIFIPATIRYQDADMMEEFLSNAMDILPYLTRKPHVMTLEHPPLTWKMYSKEVFERHSEILQHLILVSIEGHVRDWGWNSVNSISTPYFGAVHWHRGMRRQKTSIGEIIASKTHFALFSAKIRHYDGDFHVRYRLHKDCLDSVNECTFIDWNATEFSSSQLAAQTFSSMLSTWYTLMPRGDFVTRHSFYEALCAESIPVVMEPDYFKHCAFHDIINYREFVRILPEVSFMGNKSQNAVQMVKSDHETVRAAQMLLNLGQINHIFQYSLNPSHELIRFDKRTQLHKDDDAFTFTWKAILRHICKVHLDVEKC